jgi:hypothetical protein
MDALAIMMAKLHIIEGKFDILLGYCLQTLLIISLHHALNFLGILQFVIGIFVIRFGHWAGAIAANTGHLFPPAPVVATQFVGFITITLEIGNKKDQLEVFIHLSPVFVVPNHAFFLEL